MPSTRYRDVVVIGASAGGVQTLSELVSGLPAELPATLLVTQHTSADSPAVLPSMLARAGPLPASLAEDGEPMERGRIYVAPPDHHLLAGDDRLRVSRGPRENGHRPAVDPLFRSAARSYRQRVVGVVLSGTLDDGTAGLIAIKSRGGVAIVQDPTDALHRGMPENAIAGDHPDYIVPVAELADLLCRLVEERLRPAPFAPAQAANATGNGEASRIAPNAGELTRSGAEPAPVTCPECGGPLFERHKGGLTSYQCLVGHRYSAASLETGQARQLEASLWSAVRGLYERAELLRRLAHERRDDTSGLASRFDARARMCEEQAEAVVTAIQQLGRDALTTHT